MARKYAYNGGCVAVEILVLGPIANNTYIISDGQATFVVDPSCEADAILQALGKRPLDTIVITHRHGDHMNVAAAVKRATGARTVASEIDAPGIENPVDPERWGAEPCPVDLKVKDGDVVTVGSMRLKVIMTPGHTEGSMCLLIEPKEGDAKPAVLIAGDTLFAGAIGRTDLEGGNMAAMRRSLRKLERLDDSTVVLTGHNDLTTIGAERRRVFAFYL